MEIKYQTKEKLVIGDDIREFVFLDLANLNYEIEGYKKHYWVLYMQKELVGDNKINFTLGTSYYLNGRCSELYFGYFLNDINRRKIEFNEDGTVKRDYIILFDPRKQQNGNYYYATVPQNVILEDYLSAKKRLFENYNKSERIINHILGDDIVSEYIYYSDRYCNLLNYYCEDSELLKSIVQRFDDDWFLRDLERDIRVGKSLKRDYTNIEQKKD